MKRLLGLAAVLLLFLAGGLVYTFLPLRLEVEEGVFSAPSGVGPEALPETTLSLLKTGKMFSQQSFAYRGGSWGTVYESGMAAALVRHPRASFLFDAGFGTNVDQHAQTMPWLMRQLASYTKEPPAVAQLSGHGIAPSQIRMVILSHSHWDHISGLEDFPGVEVWMPPAELDFIRARRYPGLADQMIDRLKVHLFEFTDGPYENFDRSLDLFNDRSVVLVPLPGHTWGSTGMFVNLRSGKRYLFTGDLTWALDGFTRPAERPWIARRLVDDDPASVRRSILKVHQLMQRYPDLIIVPAHDRRVHDRMASLPDLER